VTAPSSIGYRSALDSQMGAAWCLSGLTDVRGPRPWKGGAANWYGADPAWAVPFERSARRAYGSSLRAELEYGLLTYQLQGLEIRGRRDPVPVVIQFWADPPYATYGLLPHDYPRVFAAANEMSKHRMPDDALCLYHPGDPPARRWTPADGLLALFGLARDHLFFEHHWRYSGGYRTGEWLGPEAPHGLRRSRAA
jgi:hypothetical protein